MPVEGAEALWGELDAYAQTLEPALKRAFLRAIVKLRAEVTEEELAQVVRTGDPGPIMARFDLTQFRIAFRFAVSNVAEATTLPGVPFAVHFDLFNPYVARALQLSELTLVNTLTQTVKDGLAQAITAGARAGLNPIDTARGLRTLVGLTPKQVQSAVNYHQLLTGGAQGQPLTEALRRATRDGRFDRTIANAIEAKVSLPEASVTAQVKRFEERLIKQRAETLVRTETITALYEGQHLKWQQAISEGKVQEAELRRFWHVAKDDRVCPFCEPIPGLNEDGVAFNQPFQTVEGVIMGPAAHPLCRCVVFVRFL